MTAANDRKLMLDHLKNIQLNQAYMLDVQARLLINQSNLMWLAMTGRNPDTTNYGYYNNIREATNKLADAICQLSESIQRSLEESYIDQEE